VVSSTTNYYDPGNPLYPWQVFNYSGQRYQSIRSDYSSSTGNYTGTVNQTTVDGSLIGGEWVQLELPNKISLNRFTVALNMPSHGGRMGRSYVLAGSNNGSTWTTVSTHTQPYGNGADGKDVNHDVNSTTMYKYYRLIATATFHNTQANGGPWSLGNWELFGTPEYDPEAHGTDVVVKSVPNVPNTDWLEVYYDGQDYSTMPATVTDKSGNDRTGTPNGGVGFDPTYKAFTFNKTNNQYLSTSTPMSGNYVHSFSLWFKPNSLTAGSGDALFYVGALTGSSSYKVELFMESDRINYTFGGNQFQAYPTIENGKWYHVVVTYNGDGGQNGREIYLNNVKLSATHSGSADNLNLTSSNLDIGRYTPDGSATTSAFDGSIANFRLFNRVLTSDEIYQLYAYQKEYFGHGDLGVTLKAGRLGIGTSEPRAALDVRGDARFNFAYRELHMYSKPDVYIYNSSGTALTLPYNASGKYLFFRFPNYYSKNFEPIIASDYRYYVPENGLYFVRFTPFGGGTLAFEWFINKNRNARNNNDDINYDDGFGPYAYANGVSATTISAIIPMTTTDYITFGVYTNSTNFDMNDRSSACITLIQRF